MSKELSWGALHPQGLLFVFSSPSGAGKTVLTRTLCERDPSLHLSVSMTTRSPRAQEKHGRDYFFTDRQTFQAHIEHQEFAEYAQVFQHFYGTLAENIFVCQEAGKDLIFDIDWQGARQLKSRYGEKVVTLFILPPSLQELDRRLRARAQDAHQVIEHRMAQAVEEMSHWHEYDYLVMNVDLEQAVAESLSIIYAERLKHRRHPRATSLVSKLTAPF